MMIIYPNIYLPETCYKGQIRTDGCFVTPYVTPLAGSYIAKVVGMGGSIVIVLDIPLRQIMGGTRPKIERTEIQLTGKIPLTQKSYIIQLIK